MTIYTASGAISGRELEGVAKIKVIGVGGGGSNAVSRMFKDRVSGVEYIVMNIKKFINLWKK